MNYTNHLGLSKPLPEEKYDIAVNNGNLDLIDAAVESVHDTLTSLNTVAFSGSYADLGDQPTIPAPVAVKGNAESAYRTGNVNLTPANIGALPATGNAVSATKATQDGNGQNIANTYVKCKTYGGYAIQCISPDTSNCYNAIYSDPLDADGTFGFYMYEDAGSTLYNMDSNRFIAGTSLYNGVDLGSSGITWKNIYATNGTIQTSDRNKKNTIEELSAEKAHGLIMGLQPSTYKMDAGTSGRTHWGMISQDVEELLNDLGMTSLDFAGFIKSPKVAINESVDEDGRRHRTETIMEGEYNYSLRYDEFIAPLIKVVQEQEKRIGELESRLSELTHA